VRSSGYLKRGAWL